MKHGPIPEQQLWIVISKLKDKERQQDGHHWHLVHAGGRQEVIEGNTMKHDTPELAMASALPVAAERRLRITFLTKIGDVITLVLTPVDAASEVVLG